MPIVPVDVSLCWKVLHHQMMYEVPYKFGGKPCDDLSCDSVETKSGCDCSFESRYLVARGTNQEWILPDGSATQHEWFIANSFREIRYADAVNPDYYSGRLFIAFESPHPIGHVWLVSEGRTLESRGKFGPTSQNAADPIYRHICSGCYELPAA